MLFTLCSLLLSCSDTQDENPSGNGNGGNGQNDLLNLVMFDHSELLQIRQIVKEKSNTNITAACDNLITAANNLLDSVPKTVLDGSTFPGASPHDYWAIGNYSWFIDGKWKRIDGEKNPEAESEKYDSKQLNTTVGRINILALAWFYSQDEKYAAKAAEFIRVWFLNEDTKMNPNFEYGCAYGDVREEVGIVSGAQFVKMLDGIRLLALSNSWTADDDKKMKQWFKEYNEWLLTSDLGRLEGQRGNNHEGWYTAQIAAGAIYYGDRDLVKQMVEKGKTAISWQVSRQDTAYIRGGADVYCPQGSLWREMYRESSLSYSIYGLRALCAIAGCADAVGEDLWHYTDSDGRSLLLAFNFLVPYLRQDKEWTWKGGTTAGTRVGAIGVMRQAAKKFNKIDFRTTITKLIGEVSSNDTKRAAYLEGINP